MTSSVRTFKKGEFLFHEGDISRSMYLIKKGRVAILKPKGTAFIQLAEVRQNEMIGELAFFDPEHKPRSASAMAMTSVEVVEISYESLQKHYESLPDFMRKIFGSVVDRIRKANDTIKKLQKDLVVVDSLSRQAETPDEDSADIDLLFGRGPVSKDGDPIDPNDTKKSNDEKPD